MIVRVKHVNKVRVKGRWYYYHRLTGERLPDDSQERAARALEINRLSASTPNPEGSLGALIGAYKAHRKFTDRAEKTRKDYKRYLAILESEFGQFQVKEFDREAVIQIQDKYAENARTADYMVSILGVLFSFAIDRPSVYGLKINPAAKVGRLAKPEGHRVIEENEIDAFRKRHPVLTKKRVAFELLLNTAQRGGDVVKMGRMHVREGMISVVQQKTGERVEIPIAQDLKVVLDAWNRVHPHAVFLTVGPGRPMPIDYFRHMMREAFDEAGLPEGTTSHGLRYAQATRLRELGLEGSIPDFLGHTTAQMARKYSERRRRSRIAVAKLNAASRKP